MKYLISLALLLGSLVSPYAQVVGFGEKEEIADFCETVLVHIKDNEIELAFDLLKEQWLFEKSELTSVQLQMIQQLPVLEERYGDPFDVALVQSEEIRDLIMRYTYVVKYDNHILRWVFFFYKPETRWILNTFYYDDSIEALFGAEVE
jgi:hypothetical protein